MTPLDAAAARQADAADALSQVNWPDRGLMPVSEMAALLRRVSAADTAYADAVRSAADSDLTALAYSDGRWAHLALDELRSRHRPEAA